MFVLVIDTRTNWEQKCLRHVCHGLLLLQENEGQVPDILPLPKPGCVLGDEMGSSSKEVKHFEDPFGQDLWNVIQAAFCHVPPHSP